MRVNRAPNAAVEYAPVIEGLPMCVALHRVLFDQELHALEEGCGGRWRLLAQQDVKRVSRREAQRVVLAFLRRAALGIGAIGEPVVVVVLAVVALHFERHGTVVADPVGRAVALPVAVLLQTLAMTVAVSRAPLCVCDVWCALVCHFSQFVNFGVRVWVVERQTREESASV